VIKFTKYKWINFFAIAPFAWFVNEFLRYIGFTDNVATNISIYFILWQLYNIWLVVINKNESINRLQ